MLVMNEDQLLPHVRIDEADTARESTRLVRPDTASTMLAQTCLIQMEEMLEAVLFQPTDPESHGMSPSKETIGPREKGCAPRLALKLPERVPRSSGYRAPPSTHSRRAPSPSAPPRSSQPHC